jgi:hypothetical protein
MQGQQAVQLIRAVELTSCTIAGSSEIRKCGKFGCGKRGQPFDSRAVSSTGQFNSWIVE